MQSIAILVLLVYSFAQATIAKRAEMEAMKSAELAIIQKERADATAVVARQAKIDAQLNEQRAIMLLDSCRAKYRSH